MPFTTKSLFSLRSWLFYAEVLAVIGFVLLAAFYIRRGSAESEATSVAQAATFIEKADALFEKQDLADAVLFYWQALRALETHGKGPEHFNKRHVSVECGSPPTRQSSYFRNLLT